MGLALCVGMLADSLSGEPDEAQYFEEQLTRINEVLAKVGLPAHNEPTALPSGLTFSCSMWGYSGLHYLRRIAAWDALNEGLPDPGDDSASQDPLINTYNQRALQDASIAYTHLMLHSDAEGYYLPQAFDEVLFPEDQLGIAGSMIGSASKLYAECVKLAHRLRLPQETHAESDQVLEAAERQGAAFTGWQRYGVESYTCLQLLRACEISKKSGAAIVLC